MPIDSTSLTIKGGEITKIIKMIKKQLFMLNQSEILQTNIENS